MNINSFSSLMSRFNPLNGSLIPSLTPQQKRICLVIATLFAIITAIAYLARSSAFASPISEANPQYSLEVQGEIAVDAEILEVDESESSALEEPQESKKGIDGGYQEQRTLLTKTRDVSLSILRELLYGVEEIRNRIADRHGVSFDDPGMGKEWNKESEGLYVFVHGLQGYPSIWNRHREQLENEQNRDVFVPYVPLSGNGDLEEVASPILEVIKTYIAEHPLKPICLIGHSNGGRICTWLETELRSIAPSVPVRVSTVAAVHFGSSKMNILKHCHDKMGVRFGLNSSVITDLSLGSEKAREILQKVSLPLEPGVVRSFQFYGSTEDAFVPELRSSIPFFEDPSLFKNHDVTHHVIHGYSHSGMVPQLAVEQMQSCEEWMEKCSP